MCPFKRSNINEPFRLIRCSSVYHDASRFKVKQWSLFVRQKSPPVSWNINNFDVTRTSTSFFENVQQREKESCRRAQQWIHLSIYCYKVAQYWNSHVGGREKLIETRFKFIANICSNLIISFIFFYRSTRYVHPESHPTLCNIIRTVIKYFSKKTSWDDIRNHKKLLTVSGN